VARKSALTPELQTQLINLLANGVTIADTCAYVGISERTYYNWMEKGETARKDNEYVQFFHAATRARVTARVGAVAIIRKSIQEGNTDDARWFLERSDPSNWGRKDKLVIEGGVPLETINKAIRAAMAAGVENASDIFNDLINEYAHVIPTNSETSSE
jgi:hypothetical protein